MNKHTPVSIAFPILIACFVSGCCLWDRYDLAYEYDFATDLQDWVGGFADYPVDTTGSDLNLTWSHRSLPSELGTGGALHISGNNRPDDLFMFIKREIEGLKPATRYDVHYEVEFGTNAPSGCAGVGGSPGESVIIKVGVTSIEPDTVREEEWFRMNIEKGDQNDVGADAIILGNIGNSNTDCVNPVWEFKALETRKREPFQFTTGEETTAWLFAGTDSGFESTTSLYYTTVKVTFTEQE